MPLGMHTKTSIPLLIVVTFAMLQAQAKVPTFQTAQYPVSDSGHAVQADLNKDGAPDFVIGNGEILLSNGDGSYRPGGFIAGVGGSSYAGTSGDFDGDGNADVVFPNGGSDFQIAYGKGDGTFRPIVNYSGVPLTGTERIVAADFNHDGRLDLAVFVLDPYAFPHEKKVYTLINTGSGFPSYGPWATEHAFHNPLDGEDYEWQIGDFMLGDFDSDGNADIAYSVLWEGPGPGPAHVRVVALFGNGTQALTAPTVVKDTDGAFFLTSADINQDTNSDLVGTDSTNFVAFYGSDARTFTERTFKDDRADAFPWRHPVAGDFNGDRRLDIASLAIDRSGQDTFGLVVAAQTATGSFVAQPYSPLGLYQSQKGTVPARLLLAADYDRNRKPDLMTISDTDQTLFLALNTTAATGFPACLPGGGQSVHVCSPAAGGTTTSPVSFKVAASKFVPLRKIEVWVDGIKKKETFFSYSGYSFMNSKLSLPAGSHTIGVFGVGYDSMWVKSTFTITVRP